MHDFWYKRVRRTWLISLGCASFLGGAWVAPHLGWPQDIIWMVLGGGLLVLCIAKRAVLAVPAVIVAGLLFGLWRGSDTHTQLTAYRGFFGTKQTVQGRIVEDPSFDSKGQLDLMLGEIKVEERTLPGTVRVKSFAPVSIRRGDVVQSRGKLYDGFGSYQASMYYAELRIVSHNAEPIDVLRGAFAASVYNNVPEPQASLGLGFLLGLKSQLPAQLDDQLKILGLTHIVVASGYNLTILVRLARRLFAKRSAYQTIVVAGLLVVAFLAVTGLSPSMSRAALVTGLALWAWYYGLRFHPVVLLLLAATITVVINPIFMWSDLGWWLSFLAFAGVMLLAPLLQARLYGDKKPKLVGQIMLETLSAQLATWPLILCIFGGFSVLSLPANLLVVPLIPLTMALTFVAGVAGFVAGPLAAYVALPAGWLLTYLTDIIALMAAIPWATLPVTISVPVMLGLFAALLVVGLVLWRKTRYNYLSSSIVE